MEIDTWALNSLTSFEHYSGVPVLLCYIMFNLITGSIVDESYFMSTDFQNVVLLIKYTFCGNLVEVKSHTFNFVSRQELVFDNFLVDNVSLIVGDDEKNPWKSF